MMKNFFRILILLTLVSACDYTPIFSTEKSSFGISDFKLVNKNNLGKSLQKTFANYSDLSKERIFALEVNVEKKRVITSKDTKGNASSFRISIICDFKIYENKKILKKKKIVESFLYNNSKNKFELKKYESKIEDNLLNKIIEELIVELYSA